MACCFLNNSEDCLRLGREAHGANVCTSHFRALHHCVILHFLHTCTNPQHSQVFICHMLRIWMQKSLRRKELLWFCDFCCRYSTSEHKRVNVLVPWTAFYGHFGFSEWRSGIPGGPGAQRKEGGAPERVAAPLPLAASLSGFAAEESTCFPCSLPA